MNTRQKSAPITTLRVFITSPNAPKLSQAGFAQAMAGPLQAANFKTYPTYAQDKEHDHVWLLDFPAPRTAAAAYHALKGVKYIQLQNSDQLDISIPNPFHASSSPPSKGPQLHIVIDPSHLQHLLDSTETGHLSVVVKSCFAHPD